ncbi:MAG: hypothetical protein ACRDHZ_01330 [Ktedonobacteraceae bacterium]
MEAQQVPRGMAPPAPPPANDSYRFWVVRSPFGPEPSWILFHGLKGVNPSTGYPEGDGPQVRTIQLDTYNMTWVEYSPPKTWKEAKDSCQVAGSYSYPVKTFAQIRDVDMEAVIWDCLYDMTIKLRDHFVKQQMNARPVLRSLSFVSEPKEKKQVTPTPVTGESINPDILRAVQKTKEMKIAGEDDTTRVLKSAPDLAQMLLTGNLTPEMEQALQMLNRKRQREEGDTQEAKASSGDRGAD